MRLLHPSLLYFCAAALLTGCGYTADTIAPVNSAAKSVHGKMMGGQQPVAGATVTIYTLGYGTTSSIALASTTTDESGNFQFAEGSYSCPAGPYVPAVSGEPEVVANALSKWATGPKAGLRKASAAKPQRTERTRAHAATTPDLTQAYLYVVATGGDSGGGTNSSIALATALGPCSQADQANVEINEVSTAVFATVMQQFYQFGSGIYSLSSGYTEIAAMYSAETNTLGTLMDVSTATVMPNVTATEPGGVSITIDAAKIYSMANTLGACVNSADDVSNPSLPVASAACQSLLNYIGVEGTNTLDAAVAMAEVPFYNVQSLWELGSSKPPFGGGLSAAPNDWTIGVSYTTNTMGLQLLPLADGTPTGTSMDIDTGGIVWFPSNVAGAVGVGYFDPVTVTFGGPFGGADLVRPQYVAVDTFDEVWLTDLGSNKLEFVIAGPGYPAMTGSLTIPDDGLGGSQPPSAGAFFLNADDSFVLGYKDTNGGNDLFLAYSTTGAPSGILGTFDHAPTGLTLNTSLGSDPNDTNSPIAVAATSGASTACGLEVKGSTTQGALPTAIFTTASPCVSGGAATAEASSNGMGGSQQDEMTTATTADEVCSQMAGGCTTLMLTPQGSETAVNLVNKPMGVAFSSYEDFWVANSGNASIGTGMAYDTFYGYYPTSDRPYLHGVGNGGTMINPAAIAIDGAGNVWVSNSCPAIETTCNSFTLSEVVGIAGPTITPLVNQADQMQGMYPAMRQHPLVIQQRMKAAAASRGTAVR
jgi:hypothetical protein